MNEAEKMLHQRPLDVIEEISPHDLMWNKDWKAYAGVGQRALTCISLAMLAAGKQDVERLLDFGCGHGRVLRFLKARFPHASVTACDIDQDAVEFCSRIFGATPIRSHREPEAIEMDGGFDLIWSGSVLTHAKVEQARGFLRFFEQKLTSGGLLVFTTAGNHVIGLMRSGELIGLTEDSARELIDEYERTGFGYRDYKNPARGGLARASPSWVCRELDELSALRIVMLTERGWGRQDAFACVKDAVPS
jgi:SAM-dependent methyltransferase